jgi:hypothetical protein
MWAADEPLVADVSSLPFVVFVLTHLTPSNLPSLCGHAQAPADEPQAPRSQQEARGLCAPSVLLFPENSRASFGAAEVSLRFESSEERCLLSSSSSPPPLPPPVIFFSEHYFDITASQNECSSALQRKSAYRVSDKEESIQLHVPRPPVYCLRARWKRTVRRRNPW